jgi:hypothetical protein
VDEAFRPEQQTHYVYQPQTAETDYELQQTEHRLAMVSESVE